jgi:hypothetical protein
MLPLLISTGAAEMFSRKLTGSSGPETYTSLEWTTPMKLCEAALRREA